MKKEEIKNFCTADLHIACYLLCKGLQLLKTQKQSDKKLLFILRDTSARPQLIEEYFSNRALVNPFLYKAKLSELKTVIYNT